MEAAELVARIRILGAAIADARADCDTSHVRLIFS